MENEQKVIQDAITKHHINVPPNSPAIQELVRYALNVGYNQGYQEGHMSSHIGICQKPVTKKRNY